MEDTLTQFNKSVMDEYNKNNSFVTTKQEVLASVASLVAEVMLLQLRVEHNSDTSPTSLYLTARQMSQALRTLIVLANLFGFSLRDLINTR